MLPSKTGSLPLRRNIELKARLPSLQLARDCAKRVATGYLGVQRQIDTYFAATRGRLKLREIDGGVAQLIWYQRADAPRARGSDYLLVQVEHAEDLKLALARAHGIRGIVAKRREVFLHQFVRLHLDQVTELGNFIEFEAVLSPEVAEESGYAEIHELCREFNIESQDILRVSYSDMMCLDGS